MYKADQLDRVVVLEGIPQPTSGVPEPCVVANEHAVVISYIIWRVGSDVRAEETTAIVRLNGCIAHMFGMPNDEVLGGHPLYERGLTFYAVHKVENSSWIRHLERINSVHPSHDPEWFSRYVHLFFAFHDSTFECVCTGFEFKLKTGFVTIQELADCLQSW